MYDINLPNRGFCIFKENTIYIDNKYIIGFKIRQDLTDNIYYLTLISLNAEYDIFTKPKHVNIDKFKTLCKIIINDILELLQYNGNNNIDIDEIIDEVINNE